MMNTQDARDERRMLTPDLFKPKPEPSLAASPDAVRLSRKLAEAQGAALSGLSPAPWRILADRILEQDALPADGFGSWCRYESAAGSMAVHLSLDMPAISALCESAMGGTGTEPPFAFEERPLSAIEKDLARAAIAATTAAMTQALTEQFGAPVSLFGGAAAGEGDMTLPKLVMFVFIANIFGYSGEIRLAVPVDELAAQFAAAAGSNAVVAEDDGRKALLQQEISKSEARFEVSLGRETMLVEEIGALVPGCLVRLNATTMAPVVVSSGGTPVYLATLARNGDRLAVRISGAAS